MSHPLSKEYQGKVDSCIRSIHALHTKEISNLLDAYGEKCFPETPITKKAAFQEVLCKELSDAVFKYFEQKCNLRWLKDSRSSHEYAVDLVLGWLIEDAVMWAINHNGGTAILHGHDRFREFLTPHKISTQPDIIVQGATGERKLEVLCDWKDTWQRKNHADLRDKKYVRLRTEKALLFGIAPISLKGFLIDLSVDDGDFEEGFIPAYRKNGYTCRTIRNRLMSLTDAFCMLVTQFSPHKRSV
jgi:hypothetical protein